MQNTNENELKWYLVSCPNGSENNAVNKVKEILKKINQENLIEEILIPYTLKFNTYSKKKAIINYFFMKTINNEIITKAFQQTKIISFMKNQDQMPVVVSEEEINNIKNKLSTQEQVKNAEFKIGDLVDVNQEPFNDFKGVIDSIDNEKQNVIVLIKILGRTTPVELPFNAIKRIL